MAREDYAVACPLLERSEALDPGIGTEFNLARCEELWGHIASAWSVYQRVVTETHAAGQSQREEVARKLMVALEPRLAHVTVRVPDPPPAGLQVRLDGAPLDSDRWAAPVPVDPGDHLVEASAPSMQGFTSRFAVTRDAQDLDVNVPAPPPRTSTAPAYLGPIPPPAPVAESPPHDDAFGTTQAWIAAAAGGAGLVAAGIGSFFGIRAITLDAQSSPYCNGGSCTQPGYSDLTQAQSSASASTISFSIGGALLASAVVLWLTRPHPSHR